MRTQVGRLTREHNKSGSGRKELTDRDKWIVEKFGFLGPHIARIKTRSATNVSISNDSNSHFMIHNMTVAYYLYKIIFIIECHSFPN
jgi:hypothetical protein